MLSVQKGRYVARFADGQTDVEAAQRLRYLAFSPAVPTLDGLDADSFDPLCSHVLVEETASGRLVCCFRILPFRNGAEIYRSYSAQHYEISGLSSFSGRLVEMGRFCIHPACRDADILRIAWAALTRYVDENGIQILFGCASFKGTSSTPYRDTFSVLNARHLAPRHWRPGVKSHDVVRFPGDRAGRMDAQQAMRKMPPLLRSYLRMGGWVTRSRSH